jgi:phosphorylcholine metabolism protein LicD
MNNNSYREHEQEAANILAELHAFFNKYNIRVWLDQGTLIDAIIERKVKGISLVEEWARPLKLDFRFQDAVPLLENINNVVGQAYNLQVHDSSIDLRKGSIKINMKGYQLKSKDEIGILDSEPLWYVTYINLYSARFKRGAYGYVIPHYYFDNLNKIDLYGLTWSIPSQIQKYLVWRYGDDWQERALDEPDGAIVEFGARELKQFKLKQLKDVYHNRKLTYMK